MPSLSLRPSAAVALGKLFHFYDADTVEVALDGVLQSRGGHGKLDGLCRTLTHQERIDQSHAEGIAAAHSVDKMEAVGFGEVVVLAVVEHGRPVVVAGRDGGTEGDGYLLESERIGELLGYALVALVVQLAAVDIGVLGLDAKDVFCIIFIGDADVNILAEVGHSGSCLLSRPQLTAVAQVAGDLDAALLRGLALLGVDNRPGSDTHVGVILDRIGDSIGGTGGAEGDLGIVDADAFQGC